MWYVMFSIIILIVVPIALFRSSYDKVEGIVTAIFIDVLAGFALVVIGWPLLGFTTGLLPDYSHGERQGFVTKISEKGIFFRTYEAQIQIGTGQLAALQEPFHFSIVNSDFIEPLQEHMKTSARVKIEYRQWIVQPFRDGESGYELLSIEGIE